MDLKKPETKCNITNALQKFGCTLNKALTFLNVIPLFPPQLMIYLTLLLLAFSLTFFSFLSFFLLSCDLFIFPDRSYERHKIQIKLKVSGDKYNFTREKQFDF